MAITRHQYRIYIKAPVERVWQAILDPDFTRRYFHGTAFDAPPQQGEPYRTRMGDVPAIDGTIEVLDPPHRLVMTWHVLYDAAMEAEPPGRVEWTLTPAGDGLTQVDLVHGDLARSPLTWAHVRTGWVWILDGLKTLLETGDTLPAVADGAAAEDAIDDAAVEWHRAQGIECNNSIWDLLGEPPTPERDEELLRRAYASCYHWQRAARRQPVNEVRGRYMLSKVHHAVGQPERALHYAEACLTMCNDLGLGDFDLAYALEVRARALKALGRDAEADQEWARAKAVPIADPEDLAIVEADLATGP